jgi:hypothetical protein
MVFYCHTLFNLYKFLSIIESIKINIIKIIIEYKS